jgi:hypothetical protein
MCVPGTGLILPPRSNSFVSAHLDFTLSLVGLCWLCWAVAERSRAAGTVESPVLTQICFWMFVCILYHRSSPCLSPFPASNLRERKHGTNNGKRKHSIVTIIIIISIMIIIIIIIIIIFSCRNYYITTDYLYLALRLYYITPKIRIVSMLIIVDLQTTFHT